jgi:hypothetical protein
MVAAEEFVGGVVVKSEFAEPRIGFIDPFVLK